MSKRFVIFFLALSILSFSCYAEDAPSKDFTLNTTAFLDKGILPVLYTCAGKDKSPELDWTNVPAKTTNLALILVDNDAPNGPFYHWVLYNIPKSVTKFEEGMDKPPSGVLVGKNSWGKQKYNGPCPPLGASHTYTLTLYALDTKLNVPAGADAKAILEAMKSHTVGKVELTTVFSRWLK